MLAQHKYPGLFFVIEGMDGSGKSTLARLLEARLLELNYPVTRVAEPGGTPLGMHIREVFFKHHDTAVAQAEVGLLLVSKIQLLHEVVFPALQRGDIVISDRYTYTLLAYQHHFKGHSRKMIMNMIHAFDAYFVPNTVCYLDVSPEISVLRTKTRAGSTGETNSLDETTIAERIKLRDGFLNELQILFKPYEGICTNEPQVLQYSSETQSPETLTEVVLKELLAAYKARQLELDNYPTAWDFERLTGA